MSAEILIKSMTIDTKKIKKVSDQAFNVALEKAGVQFLSWVNAGSPSQPATPPIRWGVLRGSSSVFVGDKHIQTYPEQIKSGSDETPEPVVSYSGEKGVITVIYNVEYAFKMHEERGKTWENLGPYSVKSKNATDKWLEKHIASDSKDLYDMIARIVSEELAKGFVL